MNKIKDLIEISRRYGSNRDYVIAGGGNTSYKNDEFLWIKGSGTSLANIDEDGFVRLDRKKLKIIAGKTYPVDVIQRENEVKSDLTAAINDNPGKRPSVETSLHELLDFAFVVHTHPAKVNGLTCSVNAAGKTKELFGDDALFVEYTDPGYVLFKKVMDKMNEYEKDKGKQPQIVMLENHGVFVAADTVHEIDELYKEINEKLDSEITQVPPAQDGDEKMGVFKIGGERKVMLKKTSPLISRFIGSKSDFEKVSVAFTPDNIVYCKAFYPFVESEAELQDTVSGFAEEKGYMPRVIGVRGEGIIILEENEKSAKTALEVYEDMLKTAVYAENFGGSKPMTPEQIAFIDNWEVENYRRKVAKS